VVFLRSKENQGFLFAFKTKPWFSFCVQTKTKVVFLRSIQNLGFLFAFKTKPRFSFERIENGKR